MGIPIAKSIAQQSGVPAKNAPTSNKKCFVLIKLS